jgi:hypothetical protein
MEHLYVGIPWSDDLYYCAGSADNQFQEKVSVKHRPPIHHAFPAPAEDKLK